MSFPEADSPEFEQISRGVDELFFNVFTSLVRKQRLPSFFAYASYDPDYSTIASGVYKLSYSDNGVSLEGENLALILGEQDIVEKFFNKLAKECSGGFLVCDARFLEKLLSFDSVVVWREKEDYRLIGNEKGILNVLCPSDRNPNSEINSSNLPFSLN